MYTEYLLNRGRRGNFISLSKFTRFLLLSRANESIKKVVNIFVKKERNKCRRNCFTDSVIKTLTKKILTASLIDKIFFPILIRKYNAFSSRDTTICETKYEQKYDQFKTLKLLFTFLPKGEALSSWGRINILDLCEKERKVYEIPSSSFLINRHESIKMS